MRFKDQVVVLTGAAKPDGIGFAAAKIFAAEGALVVINDLVPARVDEAVQRLKDMGGQAMAAACDATDDVAVNRTVERILAQTGHIDVLCNNAGMHFVRDAVDTLPSDWRRMMAINVDAMFYWSQAVAKRSMLPRRKGAIVNTGSGASLVGIPKSPAYVASKHAVLGLTRALAVEWGPYGVRVNAIGPGLTMTDMVAGGLAQHAEMFADRQRRIPLGCASTPDEPARAMVFLASSDASSVHGHLLMTDGGTTAMSAGYTPTPPPPL